MSDRIIDIVTSQMELDRRHREESEELEQRFAQERDDFITRMSSLTGTPEDFWRQLYTPLGAEEARRNFEAMTTEQQIGFQELISVPRFNNASIWEYQPNLIMPYLNYYLDDMRVLNGIVTSEGYENAINAEISARGLLEIPAPTETMGEASETKSFAEVLSDILNSIVNKVKELFGIYDFDEHDDFPQRAESVISDVFTPEVIAHWPYMSME